MCDPFFFLLFFGEKGGEKEMGKVGNEKEKKKLKKRGGLSLVGSSEAPLMLLLPSNQRKTSRVVLLNLMQLLDVPKPEA